MFRWMVAPDDGTLANCTDPEAAAAAVGVLQAAVTMFIQNPGAHGCALPCYRASYIHRTNGIPNTGFASPNVQHFRICWHDFDYFGHSVKVPPAFLCRRTRT